jgi:predicted dehydrogenase
MLARLAFAAVILAVSAPVVRAADFVKVGILGFDNYQGLAFAQLFNDPKATGDLAGLRVTTICPLSTDTYPESASLVARWVDSIGKMYQKPKDPKDIVPVPEIVNSVDELLPKVDVVIISSLDGRQHLAQATPVLKAHKPLYIVRPIAASVADAIAILRLAAETKTPFFSSSQHRYSPGFIGMRDHPEVGKVLGCDVYGGYDVKAPAEADLFIRPLHSLETLYTIMRPGCATVACTSTPTAEIYTMTWKDGRAATYRGIKTEKVKYSATVFGDKGVSTAGIYGHGVPVAGVVPTKDEYMGYKGIAIEMAKFFKGGPAPVDPSETLEIFAVMQAAEESKAKGGCPVAVPDLWNSAK